MLNHCRDTLLPLMHLRLHHRLGRHRPHRPEHLPHLQMAAHLPKVRPRVHRPRTTRMLTLSIGLRMGTTSIRQSSRRGSSSNMHSIMRNKVTAPPVKKVKPLLRTEHLPLHPVGRRHPHPPSRLHPLLLHPKIVCTYQGPFSSDWLICISRLSNSITPVFLLLILKHMVHFHGSELFKTRINE